MGTRPTPAAIRMASLARTRTLKEKPRTRNDETFAPASAEAVRPALPGGVVGAEGGVGDRPAAGRRVRGGSAARVFDPGGGIQDAAVEQQLRTLGGEVARVAQRFAADDSLHRQQECAEAAQRVAVAG
jgi:hypothetical protein